MLYSKSTGGFYDTDINGAAIPPDAVEITNEQHAALLAAQSNGKVIQADASGDPVAVDPPPPTLAQAQSAQIGKMYAAYTNAIAQTVAYTSKAGVAQTYQSDPGSVGNVNDMLSAYGSAQATPSGFYWVAADNTQVPFTYADLQGLAAAMGAQGWAAFQKLQGYKSQINSATTVSAVEAVVWS